MYKLTALIENNAFDAELYSEKGLSLYIYNETEKLIFDYGLSENYWHNASRLGFNATIINKGILSHGHQDHSGGLRYMLEKNMFHTVYANEKVYNGKFKKLDGEQTYIGIDGALESAKGRFEFFTGMKAIGADLFAITDIGQGRVEDRYTDDEGSADAFDDETVLVIKGSEGIHVVVGCCHKGVRASIEAVRTHFPDDQIVSLIGGLHIYDADYVVLQDTVAVIKENSIANLIVGHCTGENGVQYLAEQTTATVNYLYTGSSYILS